MYQWKDKFVLNRLMPGFKSDFDISIFYDFFSNQIPRAGFFSSNPCQYIYSQYEVLSVYSYKIDASGPCGLDLPSQNSRLLTEATPIKDVFVLESGLPTLRRPKYSLEQPKPIS